MPMRWTPDKDQLMFMMLLKTHNISINYGAIAESWPTDQGEKPTARAISERLIKIRKQVSGGSSGAVKAPRSVNSTPSKPRAIRPPVSGGGSATTPSHKRRRVLDDIDGDDDERTISRKELRELGVHDDPRSSPTPQQQQQQPHFPTIAASAAARRSTTVGTNVMPSSERSPARALSNGEESSSASPSAATRRPTLPPAGPAAAAAAVAGAAGVARNRTSLSANAHAFAARTPASMEPTAGQLARLSVTPAANGGGGGGSSTTPRRGTSMAPIKLEKDDALGPEDLLEDDSDVSDWAAEYV